MGTPRLSYMAALENDVIEATNGKLPADSEPGLARTDNDGLHPLASTPGGSSGRLSRHKANLPFLSRNVPIPGERRLR